MRLLSVVLYADRGERLLGDVRAGGDGVLLLLAALLVGCESALSWLPSSPSAVVSPPAAERCHAFDAREH